MDVAAFRLKPVMWFLFGAVTLFGGQLLIDAWLSAYSLSAPVATPEHANLLATGLSRSSNQLVALIMTSIVLAIPLTANMYTPKLIEMFITHPVNRAILPFFVFAMAQANFALFAISKGWIPRFQLLVLLIVQLSCFVLLIPYFYFVIRFIDPENIIARVTERALRTIDQITAGNLTGLKAKEELVERMYDLTNISLRAIDRADRQVAAAGLWALRRVARRYGEVKPHLSASWFEVEKKFFVGLSKEALDLLADDRVWVEQKYLTDLAAAFLPSLTKIPDTVSALSDIARVIAHDAEAAGDVCLLEHAIRHFNTILREAIKSRNVHATFDILQNYKLLTIALIDRHPEKVEKIGWYFRYYGQVALAAGLPLVVELAAYDFGEITRTAFERQSPSRQPLLDHFLLLGWEVNGKSSARLVKARVLLAAYLLRTGCEEEARLIVKQTVPLSSDLLREVTRDLLETSEPYFWEITDRQVNLDYTPENDRASVLTILSQLETAGKL